jgi:hypothetical protein
MKRILLGVALATLLISKAQACTIVTDGTIEVYWHELAHCNGWDHKPFERGHEPPASYVHDFNGPLTVYLTGHGMGQITTMNYAQFNAKIILAPDRTVPQLCGALWKQHGVIAAQKDINSLIGCSIRE